MTDQELNVLICEKIMGWTVKKSKYSQSLRLHNGKFFFANLDDYKFSSDMTYSWEIIEQLSYCSFSFGRNRTNGLYTSVFINPNRHTKKWAWTSKNPSLAICKSALRCVGVKIK